MGTGLALRVSPEYGIYLLWMVVATAEILRTRIPRFRQIFVHVMGGILRPEEEEGAPTAAPAMATGILFSWWIAPPEYFWVSVVCAAVIDPVARVIGIHYGITPFPGAGKKTCEGFLGALIAGAMVASAAGCIWPRAALVGLAAALGEIVGRHEPWWRDDNALVPVFVSVCLRFL